jgi:hypothetical protein
MSSAAKAKPVVLAVGVSDGAGSERDGTAGDDPASVGEGDARALGLTVVVPQAARSSDVATSRWTTGRTGFLSDNRIDS